MHLYVDFSEPFLMMVAAGPFTTSDSLCYEPLADLMKTVKNDKPDLLILVRSLLITFAFLHRFEIIICSSVYEHLPVGI